MNAPHFRGYCPESKAWVYGNYTSIGQSHEIQRPIKNSSRYCSQVDKDSIGMYSGFTDKNNRKIYQGDIAELWYAPRSTCKGVIKYKKGAFWFCTSEATPNESLLCEVEENGNYLTVIGNEFEDAASSTKIAPNDIEQHIRQLIKTNKINTNKDIWEYESINNEIPVMHTNIKGYPITEDMSADFVVMHGYSRESYYAKVNGIKLPMDLSYELFRYIENGYKAFVEAKQI
jgi:hypothetical protein